MIIFVSADDADKSVDILNSSGVRAQICGRVVPGRKISFESRGQFSAGQMISSFY